MMPLKISTDQIAHHAGEKRTAPKEKTRQKWKKGEMRERKGERKRHWEWEIKSYYAEKKSLRRCWLALMSNDTVMFDPKRCN
jgi:hypothetical protein